jgi:hypothetical protein
MSPLLKNPWIKVGCFPVRFGYIPDEKTWNKYVRPWIVKDPDYDKEWEAYPAYMPGRTTPITNNGALRIAVTLGDDPDDVSETLVHEAVHVWQMTAEFINGGNDWETEAYHIAFIWSTLFDQWMEAKDREKSSTTVD